MIRRIKAGIARLAWRHPRLYASRHVVRTLAQMGIAATGITALVWLLVPQIDWAWIRSWIPEIDLSWLWSWIVLPDLSWLWAWIPPLPGWLKTGLGWARWWVPVVVAILVAIEEVERRGRKRRDPDSEG